VNVAGSDTAVSIYLGFLSQNSVAAVVYSEYRDAFDMDLSGTYLGKRVRVAGRIDSREGRPIVRLCLPSQIKVIGEASGEFDVSGPPVLCEEAGAHVGELVTVEGDVTHVASNGSVYFLNFEGATADRGFTAYIPSSAVSKLEDGFDLFYVGKRLQVAGVVYLHHGKPQIQIDANFQIRVVGPAKNDACSSPTAIDVLDAGDYVNTVQTIRGRVANVAKFDNFAFINFEGLPFREGFEVFIPGSAFDSMESGFDTFYAGREVLVTGEVNLHKGRPTIKVTDKRQISVVPRSKESPRATSAPVAGVEIGPGEAADHVGEVCTVVGQVANVTKGDKFAYVDLDGVSRGTGLSIFIPASTFDRLPSGFEEFWIDRVVRISGPIELHKGRPEIKILSSSQVVVLPVGAEAKLTSPGPPSAAATTDRVAIDQAHKHLGSTKVIEAVVSEVDRQERHAFIRFEGTDKDGFYVFVPASAFAQLHDGFESFYPGKTLRVTGTIQLHKGSPQIIVTQTGQLEVVYDESSTK
jgi:DNA/RNA endonuclease YhcR with UshA esterase domain